MNTMLMTPLPTVSEPIKKGKTWTPSQLARGAALRQRREALGLSQPQVINLSDVDSTTTWSRLESGTYQGRVEELLRLAERHLSVLEQSAKRQAKRAATWIYHSNLDFEAMLAAVEDAWDEATSDPGERRGETLSVVDYVAPWGFGKTEIVGQLMKHFGGVEILARDSWDKSPFEALQSIAAQLGISKPLRGNEQRNWRSKGEAEEAILTALKKQPRVLYFSEIELGSKSLCNLWKEISNETRCVVVRLSLPEFYCQMLHQQGEYAGQVNSRTQAVITAGRLTEEDARLMFSTYAPRFKLTETVAAQLAAYATQLGGRRCLKEVAKRMDRDKKLTAAEPSLAKVEEHCLGWRKDHGLVVRQVPAALQHFQPRPKWPKLES